MRLECRCAVNFSCLLAREGDFIVLWEDCNIQNIQAILDCDCQISFEVTCETKYLLTLKESLIGGNIGGLE